MLHEESFLHKCQGLEKGWHLFGLPMRKLVSCYRLQSWLMLAIRVDEFNALLPWGSDEHIAIICRMAEIG